MNKLILTGLLLTLSSMSFAQNRGWQHLDIEKDTVFGISTTRAYEELLKGKKSTRVIVGIVDAGIDTLQEDLRSIIWTDAKTGAHGWNYIGPETGQEDITRLAIYKKEFYDNLVYTTVPELYRAGYQQHWKLEPVLKYKIRTMQNLAREMDTIEALTDVILKKMGKTDPSAEDLRNYHAAEETEFDQMKYLYTGMPNEQELIKNILQSRDLYPDWQTYRYNEMDHIRALVKSHLAHGLNPQNKERDTARGNYDISPDKLGPVRSSNMAGAYHGTHVAGIIGAVRGNNIGMDGVADNVQILMLKENGTLREMRDESLARAIRFAVDHGAKVINLSFGKPYTWNKKVVDGAVKYAMAHDVLLVHAAGNEGNNLDTEEHYPNPNYLSGGHADAWIEVGASGWKDDSTLAVSFSNYGKRDVDVFAPGAAIYSTIPYNKYDSWDGTSMATPMVTGLVALIREYYPALSAVQVKDIIMKSVVKRAVLTDKCVSGGVVNAYNALKLAAAMSLSRAK